MRGWLAILLVQALGAQSVHVGRWAGDPSGNLDALHQSLRVRSRTYAAALRDIEGRPGAAYQLLDGRLPGGTLGLTVLKGDTFYVFLDAQQCFRFRKSLPEVLAHEIRHVLDGCGNPQGFHSSAGPDYGHDPTEVAARTWARTVLSEL